MKNKKISELILIILSIIMIYLLVRKNYLEIINSIINANYLWILLAVICYCMYLLLQAIPFYKFAKVYDENVKLSYFVYLMIVTNFFNGITPLATGGQPLQVYELHKRGITTVHASNVVIQHTIIYEIAVVLWIIVSVIINQIFHIVTLNSILKHAAILGIVLNILFLGGLLFISFSKNFNKKVINWIIDLLTKIHLVKNPTNQKEKWDKTCTDFYTNSQELLKHKKLFVLGIILLLFAYAFNYIMPIFIAKAIHLESNLTIPITFIISCYVSFSSSFLPIPGATGGTEYAFLGYFGKYITGYKLNTLLILWRFLTYYLPTITGGIVFNLNALKQVKKE